MQALGSAALISNSYESHAEEVVFYIVAKDPIFLNEHQIELASELEYNGTCLQLFRLVCNTTMKQKEANSF